MKVRQGFVSNSSSSSFVFATTVENHERALNTFMGDEKKFLENFPFGKQKGFGQDVITISDLMENGGYGNLYYNVNDAVKKAGLSNSDDWHEVLENYQKKANEQPDNVFEWNSY